MGVLLLFNGGFMLLSSFVSILTKDGQTLALSLAALLTLLVGIVLMLVTRNHTKQLNKRDGYLVVSLGWILMTLTGMLPYLFTGVFPDISSAFFETMSGYTTTGSSVLADIEVVPKGIFILAKYHPLDRGDGNHRFSDCYFTALRDRRDAVIYSRSTWTKQ